MTICILGRQPKLSLAELESIYGSEAVKPIGELTALVDAVISPDDHRKLGGTIKVAKMLIELPTTNWPELVKHVEKTIPKHLEYLPEGKLKFGLSVYGINVKPKTLQANGLSLKKVIKNAGRSVRLVPNTAHELSSAQVLHNQLAGPMGMELLFVAHGNKTILAQTTSIQNIDDYSKRDFDRPMRDAFVGMLPPKLAQIMLNFATGGDVTRQAFRSPKSKVAADLAARSEPDGNITASQPLPRILDPFCGTGVVLQEAALIGHPVYGTDISEKMVRYTRDNLVWLEDTYRIQADKYFEVADATTHTWQQPIDTVVTEVYLGQPLSGLPKPEKLYEIIDNCNKITTNFLKNLHPQLKSGTRICIAVPAWRLQNHFKHMLLLDHLEEIGYNRVSFVHATNADLLYHRADQIVARQLLVLTRK